MLSAMRGRTPAPLFDPSSLAEVEVCTLSGKRPGAMCSTRRREHFRARAGASESCDNALGGAGDAQGRRSGRPLRRPLQIVEQYPLESGLGRARLGRSPAASARELSATQQRNRAAARHLPRDEQASRSIRTAASQEIVLSAAATPSACASSSTPSRRASSAHPSD